MAQALELDLGDAHADITDHDVYVNGVPHATFRRLREEAPVSFTEERDGRGFWSVTRYEDVLFVSRHTELFSSTQGIRLEAGGTARRRRSFDQQRLAKEQTLAGRCPALHCLRPPADRLRTASGVRM